MIRILGQLVKIGDNRILKPYPVKTQAIPDPYPIRTYIHTAWIRVGYGLDTAWIRVGYPFTLSLEGSNPLSYSK